MVYAGNPPRGVNNQGVMDSTEATIPHAVLTFTSSTSIADNGHLVGHQLIKY